MKALYIWAILLVSGGLIAIFYLIPNEQDVAFLQMKSYHYAQAEKYYAKQYAKGERSAEVLLSLSELEERQGHLKQSIAFIQEYIQSHPKDAAALSRLSNLYWTDQQMENYYLTLLQWQALENNNPTALQELASWYEYQKQDPQDLRSLLERLIRTGQANDGHYAILASLYADCKEYNKAYQFLEIRRQFFPQKVSINDILFEIWINEKRGETQTSIPLLVTYLKQKNNPKITYYALGIFYDRYPHQIEMLISKLPPDLQTNLAVQTFILQILWQSPSKQEEVYHQLIQDTHLPNLPVALQELALEIFLEEEDDEHLLQLIDSGAMQEISDRSQARLSIAALKRGDPRIAKAMQKSLGQRYLSTHLVTQTILSIGAQEEDAQEKLEDLIQSKTLSITSCFFLFQVAVQAGFTEEALVLGPRLFPYLGMNEQDQVDLAQAYLQMKHPDLLYPLLEKAIPSIGAKTIEPPLAILDIGLGNSQKVAQWLQGSPHISDFTFNALYAAAEDQKEYPLALYIAKKQMQIFPSPFAQANYGLALVQVGKVDTGLSILQDVIQKNPKNPSLQRTYVSGLSYAVKQGAREPSTLISYMQTLEQQKHLPRMVLRDIAYIYLEVLHDFSKAAAAFWILSDQASPRSTDLQSLVYLWGPNASEEQTAWLQQKAQTAPIKDLDGWLNLLALIGQEQKVISIVQKRNKEDLSLSVYFTYMNALAYEKKRKELKETVDFLLPRVHNFQQLQKLATYAEESQDLSARKAIWVAATTEHPHDFTAWDQLASCTFDGHEYEATQSYLLHAFSLLQGSAMTDQEVSASKNLFLSSSSQHPKLYQSLYRYAEILRRKELQKRAVNLYEIALQCAEKQKNSYELQRYKALILYRMGKIRQAKQVLHSLYEHASEDPDIAADYANLLMDANQFRAARSFLEKTPGKTLLKKRCDKTPGKQ